MGQGDSESFFKSLGICLQRSHLIQDVQLVGSGHRPQQKLASAWGSALRLVAPTHDREPLPGTGCDRMKPR